MMTLSRNSLAFICATAWMPSCSKPAPAPEPQEIVTPPPAPVAPPSPAAEARDVFAKRCVVCHGEHGMGDGPGAAALQPKPRHFSDATWQAATTDEHIAKTIVEGGPAVGLSPGMAANPDLAKKPEVVKELVKIVRSWRK
ncbi:MAG: hypothetical protein QM784_37035 [Polyangiaceae bacterium]